jgi:putative DNA primase/helicase
MDSTTPPNQVNLSEPPPHATTQAASAAGPGGTDGSPLDYALRYRAAVLCPLPIRRDGSKAPAVGTWPDRDARGKPRLPTEAELRQRFAAGPGVAVAAGAVSRNLAVLDIEYPDFFQALAELVEAECPGLLEELPRVATPGKGDAPGTHLYFRSPAPLQSEKLARLTPEEARRRAGDPKKTTAIEVKAEGGYVLAPGSPACCHERGRCYEHVGGPFIEEAPVLTAEQVNVLLRAARSLTQVVAPSDVQDGPRDSKNNGRPGDDFNVNGPPWEEILPDGWLPVATDSAGRVRWRRPGKDRGWSATTGCRATEGGHELFYCFTSNGEPFEENRAYSKFSAYALLHHGGDFKAAARELARQGYGPPRQSWGRRRRLGRRPLFTFTLQAGAKS